MPKRSRICLEDVVDWNNLVSATWRAASGKTTAPQVREFVEDLDRNLTNLANSVLDETVELGKATTFRIYDPKPRQIHAPIFRERVLHHALMAHVGPVLEKSLIEDTFACRIGKGSLAAVRRAQHYSRRFAWFGQLDIRQYFASICHQTLVGTLSRKFKHAGLIRLLSRIIAASPASTDRGLPIGALTSQNFANFFLSPLDRFLREEVKVGGLIRYMDDVVWWCHDKQEVKKAAEAASVFLHEKLSLQLRHSPIVNRSRMGMTICGYRVSPGRILLSQRKKRLYCHGRRRWETKLQSGQINGADLQAGYASILSMAVHADSANWRRLDLKLRPPLEITEQI